MELRNTGLGRGYILLVERLITGRLVRWGMTPNLATTLGAVLALAVPPAFALSPWAGFVAIGCSALVDSVDGQLARLTGAQTRFGAFWDSTLDRVSDCFYLTGFWVYFWVRCDEVFWLSMAFMAAILATQLISYTKARIEGLGGACGVGLMDRVARTVYLLVWALAIAAWPGSPGIELWLGLGLYLLMTLATVVQRVKAAQKNLL
jgi:phosphatidylglycerophosphate synthase